MSQIIVLQATLDNSVSLDNNQHHQHQQPPPYLRIFHYVFYLYNSWPKTNKKIIFTLMLPIFFLFFSDWWNVKLPKYRTRFYFIPKWVHKQLKMCSLYATSTARFHLEIRPTKEDRVWKFESHQGASQYYFLMCRTQVWHL